MYKLCDLDSLAEDEFRQPTCGSEGPDSSYLWGSGPSVAQIHVKRWRIHLIGDDQYHNYVCFT